MKIRWCSLENCSVIRLKIIHSYRRNYLKIWKQEFLRVSSRGLQWEKTAQAKGVFRSAWGQLITSYSRELRIAFYKLSTAWGRTEFHLLLFADKISKSQFSSFKLISNHIIFFVSLHFLLFSLPLVLFLFTSHLIRNYLDSLKREIFGNPDVVMEYPLHEMHDSYPQESRASAYAENMNIRHFVMLLNVFLCKRWNRTSRQMHCPYKLCRMSWGNRNLAFSYYSSRFVLVAKRGVMVPGVPIAERGNWGWERDGLLSSSTT